MSVVGPHESYPPLVPAAAWPTTPSSTAWDEYLGILDADRQNADETQLQLAVQFALRSAALETGAIEGLYATSRGVTRTVALQAAAWEAALDEIGPDVRGHFAAQLEAFEVVLDVATHSRPITEVWLRELHALTCREQASYKVITPLGPQDHLLEHGQYKTHENHVTRSDGTKHFYCPLADVKSEMHRLVEQLATPEFDHLSPAAQAAYAHHAFASIHPFSDGNGRVARALASVYLYRAVGVPLLIFSDQQERYWDALLAADLGRREAFDAFVEDRAIDTMAMVSGRLRESSNPLAQQTAAIRGLFLAHGGLTYAEIEATGQRLAQVLQVAMSEIAYESGLASDIHTVMLSLPSKLACNFGRPYHTLQSGGAFHFRISCDEPIPATSETTPFIGVADHVDERLAFIVIDANRPGTPPLRLRTDDLHPTVTASADTRIRSWLANAFGSALADLRRTIEGGLRQQGFAP